MKRSWVTMETFEEMTRPLLGLPVTHIWRGYGSAMFINFGRLHHSIWKNGRVFSQPNGEWSLRLTWSWRVEGRRRIWWGSWSDDERWESMFAKLIGSTVRTITLFGRLPEIDLELSCGLHLVSFMTAEGDPDWVLGDERANGGRWLSIRAGRLQLEESEARQKVAVEDICILPQQRKAPSWAAGAEDEEPGEREDYGADEADRDEG